MGLVSIADAVDEARQASVSVFIDVVESTRGTNAGWDTQLDRLVAEADAIVNGNALFIDTIEIEPLREVAYEALEAAEAAYGEVLQAELPSAVIDLFF